MQGAARPEARPVRAVRGRAGACGAAALTLAWHVHRGAPRRIQPAVCRLKAILQRVSAASVTVDGVVIGRIGPGLLVLVCAERGDTEEQADRLLAKILKLRIFGDADGKMNRSLQDVDGGLLLVSQFTLAADTSRGNRPGFSAAAAPDDGRRLYDYVVARAQATHPLVQTGAFGADMQVALVNDGPVTIPLHIPPGE